ncbi:hypothetical protein [uncultured Brevundimonas sp.]|uniref:hypothetical protein n=1 Tax=uncultured Brevundimonas sp. TaxID=213418 RepID=UPI0030EEB474|tara:strand:+ start:3667 stop:4788 length:1122 start_codon:yes stop_codon:yes gene_type:complete
MTVASRTLTALAVSALALSAAGAAAAQTPYGSTPRYDPYGAPSGSFTSSCRDVQRLENGYISAQCRTTDGFRWSTIRADDCRGDITNRDGVLSCYGATARTGPLYPDDSQGGYNSGVPVQNAPGGVLGSILGAVFGDNYGQSPGLEDDWNRGRRPTAEHSAALEARIDAGLRDGSLDRGEAARVRADFDALVRLEDRYAADGRLTTDERNELRGRYEALSSRIGDQGQYGQIYGWQPLSEVRDDFFARVDTAERARRLSRTGATRLRADFDALVRVESDYRRDGISDRERETLTTRLAELNRRIGDGGGYGSGNSYGNGYGADPRAIQIEARIAAGERNGSLSHSEADRLRAELNDLTRRWAELEVRVNQARR